MRDSIRESFDRFLTLPDFHLQPSAINATIGHPRFDFRLIRPTPRGDPHEDDLYDIAYLSHDSPPIRRSNDLTIDQRAALYSLWFLSNPVSFLLLQRTRFCCGQARVQTV
jgi:hypothetical protein